MKELVRILGVPLNIEFVLTPIQKALLSSGKAALEKNQDKLAALPPELYPFATKTLYAISGSGTDNFVLAVSPKRRIHTFYIDGSHDIETLSESSVHGIAASAVNTKNSRVREYFDDRFTNDFAGNDRSTRAMVWKALAESELDHRTFR